MIFRDLFGETHGLLDRVHLKPAPESSSDEMIVQRHLVDRKSRDPSRVLLSYHGRLSSHPDVAAVRTDVHGRIDRLHRRVSQKRKLVFGCHSLRRALKPDLDIAAFESLDRCSFVGRFRGSGADRCCGKFRVRSQLPIDIQCFDAGAGGPIMFTDDCYRVVDVQDVDYARDLPRIGFVDRFDLASVHRANHHGRGLHSINRHVDPVDRASVHLCRRIDATLGFTDDFELSGRLQLRIFGHRQGRGRFSDLSVS
jgi:hypothetical protein